MASLKLTTPVAVLIGSVIIALAILVSNGVITLKKDKVAGATTNTPQNTQEPQQTQVTLDQIKDVFGKSVIKFGDTSKKLIIIEAADPSCPYCQIAAGKNPELNKQAGSRFTLVSDGGSYMAPVPEIQRLVTEGKAAFAYIYTNGHGGGEMGTKAMYCAFENNKFWEVHNLLMTSKGYDLLNNTVKNDKTKSGEMATFLQSVIDPNLIKQCLDSGKYDAKLNEEQALAGSIGISGTPGFYFNTTLFKGAYSYTEMESAVNSVLK